MFSNARSQGHTIFRTSDTSRSLRTGQISANVCWLCLSSRPFSQPMQMSKMRSDHGAPRLHYRHRHGRVNHAKNYVDPETGVHTQEIERLWRDFKQKKKMTYGLRRVKVHDYCHEFIWRRSVKARNVDIFEASLRLLASATGDKVPW